MDNFLQNILEMLLQIIKIYKQQKNKKIEIIKLQKKNEVRADDLNSDIAEFNNSVLLDEWLWSETEKAFKEIDAKEEKCRKLLSLAVKHFPVFKVIGNYCSIDTNNCYLYIVEEKEKCVVIRSYFDENEKRFILEKFFFPYDYFEK